MGAEEKALVEKIIHYGKQSSIGIVLLSIFDILAGILSLFIAVFFYPAILGSLAVLFKVSKTAIQYKKLTTTLRAISPVVASYITIRKKEDNKMAKLKEALKKIWLAVFGNKFTLAMLAVCGSAGYAVYILSPLEFIYSVLIGAVVFLGTSYLVVTGKVGIEDIEQITKRLQNQDNFKADLKKKRAHEKKLIEAKKQVLKAEAEKLLAETKAKDELLRKKAEQLLAQQEESVKATEQK